MKTKKTTKKTTRAKSPRGKPGPVVKLLDEKVKQRLLEAISLGLTHEQAARCAGLCPTTIYLWIQKANDPDSEPIFKEFKEALEKAKAQGLEELIKTIQGAAKKDWRAAQHLAACRDPENWSKQEKRRLEVSGAEGAPPLQIFIPELQKE